MKLVITIGVMALASSLALARADDGKKTGAYEPAKVTDKLEDLLVTSLADESVYLSSVAERVCMKKLVSVTQQVVAGMNYQFTMQACDVAKSVAAANNNAKLLGKCSADVLKNCEPVEAVVTVFEQSWTNTVEVTGIELSDA